MLAALVLTVGTARAEPPSPIGKWFTEDRTGVIAVGPCGQALCGVIVGLSDWPKDGSVLRDVHGTPQCHLTLLSGLRLHNDGRWHGTVTNPEDGQAYDAEVWVAPDGDMRLRGYIGLPILGSTQHWPRFTGTVTADCHFH